MQMRWEYARNENGECYKSSFNLRKLSLQRESEAYIEKMACLQECSDI